MPASRVRRHRNSPPPHGDVRRYDYWECRCPLCREAERVQAKREREGRARPGFTHPAGTARRVQALVAHGHGFADIADRLSCNASWICQLARANRSKGILRRTADQIAVLYDELVALPPPAGRRATYARTVAARHGWHDPAYWAAWGDIDDPPRPVDLVDEVAIQRALDGMARFGGLHPADRAAVVARLAGQGLTAEQIRYRLRTSQAAVAKYLPEQPDRSEAA